MRQVVTWLVWSVTGLPIIAALRHEIETSCASTSCADLVGKYYESGLLTGGSMPLAPPDLIHERLTALLLLSRAQRAEHEAREEAARLQAETAVVEVIEVIEEVTGLSEPLISEGSNDETDAPQSQQYATFALAPPPEGGSHSHYIPTEVVYYRESDPASVVQGVRSGCVF